MRLTTVRSGIGAMAVAALITALVPASAGRAQEAAEEQQGRAMRRAGEIEEITVTARKREESVQDIPIAISAFGTEDLETANIDDVSDIQFNVPNLTFTKTNFTSSNVVIRGVGTNLVAASGDQAVGIHVNNIPLNANRIFEAEFFDVDRIEVLRGPQGTLYGRNSSAGSINVLPRRPGEDFGGYVEALYGNYDTVKVKGALNIPISDRLRARFAGFFLDRDGYTKNVATGNYIDDRHLYAGRFTLGADLAERTDATLILSWFEEDDGRSRMQKQACLKDTRPFPFTIGCLPDDLAYETVNGAATLGGELAGAFGLYPLGTDGYAGSVNPRSMRKVNAEFDPSYKTDEFLAILEVNHGIGDFTLTSLTGYQETGIWSQTDYLWAVSTVPYAFPVTTWYGDFGRDLAWDQSSGTARQISQELRLTSDFDGPLNFTVGGIYIDYESQGDYFVVFNSGEWAAQALGQPVPPSGFYRNDTDKYELLAWALFGEIYYNVTESTRLTGGVRFTHDDKQVRDRQNLLAFPLNPYNESDANWGKYSFKLGIDHSMDLGFTDDTMLYAVYSRGYKGGGFNPPVDQTLFSVPLTFDPEFIYAYEIGAKNRLFDNRVQLNLSGFFYDYDGLQTSKIIARTSVNENIDARIWGVELESVAFPTERLRFDLNVAYLATRIGDAESIDPANPTAGVPGATAIKDFVRFDGSNAVIPPGGDIGDPGTWVEGLPTDLEGNDLQNSPKWSIKAGAQYTMPNVFDRYELTFRVDHYWQDEMYGRIFNGKRDEISSWGQTDGQIMFRPADGAWWLEFWVKNMFDNDDITGMYLTDASSANFTNLFVLEPRTYGVTLRYAWGGEQ